MADKIAKRGVSIFIDGKEINNSIKSIRSEMSMLTNQQAKMTEGSDAYVAHAKKIGYLKSILVEHSEYQKQVTQEYVNMGKGAESFSDKFSRISSGFNKYFGIVASGIAVFAGVILKMNEYAEKRKELENSQANLKAITGLGDKDVSWLTKYAQDLSTTTTEAGVRITASSKEIMDGFTVIGSKRPELLKNKEAMADVTKQALILAATGLPVNDAFEAVTASMNQFNLGASQANRIINVLGAGSLEGSSEVNDLSASMKNVGTVAASSNLTLEQTVAALEVLASKQLLGEEAGTKLRGALLKMKEAGVGYVNGSFSMRDAITEINAKLKEKSNALQRDAYMQKVFGVENLTAGLVLLQNVDQYDKLTAAVTGTNVAMTQAQIRTETTSEKQKQATNRINEAGMALSGTLNKLKLFSTEFLANFMEGMAKLAGVSKTVTDEFNDQSKKVVNLKMNIEPLLTRYDELAGKANKSAAENAEMKRIIGEVTAVMPGATTAVDKYGNSIAISTDRVRQFITSQVALYGVKNKKQLDENQKLLNDVEDQLVFHKKKIDEINKTGTFITRTVTDRKSGETYDIKASAEEIKAEQDKYKKLLQDKLGYETLLKDLSGQTLKTQIEDAQKAQKAQAESDKLAAEEAKRKADEDAKGGSGSNAPDKAAIQKKKIDAAMHTLENENLKQVAAIKQRYLDGDIASEYNYNESLLDQQDKYDELRKKKLQELLKVITDPGLKLELNKQIAEIDKKALDRQIEQNNKIKKILLDADPIKSENESYNNRLRELGLFGVEKEKMTADQLETLRILEEQHNASLRKMSTKQALVDLKQLDKDQQDTEKMAADDRSSGELNEQQYKDKLLSIEIEFLKKKLLINGLSTDELDKISKQLTEKLVSSADKSAQEMLSFKEKYGIDELDRFKNQKELELKILQDYLDKGLLSEKDASKVRRILASEEILAKTKDFREIASGISDVSGVFSNAIQGFQSAEEKSIETKYQKQIDAAQKAGKDTTKIEEQKNKELAAVRAKDADANFALQVAQIISSTAVAAINAYSAMAGIAFIGPVLGGIAAGAAVAYGASQIAVAESAREAAKSGYYYGGYTGGDDPNEVRGHFPDGSPYHGKEFVATHVTTANPNTKPLLDVIDEAQKNGTASSLTKSDLAKAIGVSSGGYYSGGYKKSNTTSSGSSSGSISTEDYLSAVVSAVNRLNDHLDKGIKAPVYISGDDGVAKNLEKYNKLISNAKGL